MMFGEMLFQSCSPFTCIGHLLLFSFLQQTIYYKVGNNQLWQSRVEIQHYSIAYLSRLKHCSAELPLKARAHMLNINGWIQDKSMQCI